MFSPLVNYWQFLGLNERADFVDMINVILLRKPLILQVSSKIIEINGVSQLDGKLVTSDRK